MFRHFQTWRNNGRVKKLVCRKMARALDRCGRGASFVVSAGLATLLAWAHVAQGQASVPLEYRVKASYLYNFSKLTEWRGETHLENDAQLVIAIVGEDPFGVAIDKLAEDETRQGRKLVIKRLNCDKNLKLCHELIVRRSQARRVKAILSMVDGAGVLTVSEIEGFATQGGMIEFVFDESRVRFDINRAAAERSNLKISSRLLALAQAER